MESKSNKMLIGLICIIFGIYFIANEYFDIKMGDAVLFVLGGALLLLYRTKRKIWALVFGIIMYSLWVFRVFPYFGMTALSAMIFMIPGIIFMVLYFSKRRSSFLITGSVLSWFGVFIIFIGIPSFDGLSGAIFFICMGMSFFTMYLLNRNEIGKWPLFIAIVLIIFGIMVYLGRSPFSLFFGFIPSIIPLIFVIAGIFIILKTIISKK